MESFISIDKAVEILNENVTKLGKISLHISEAIGYILSEDAISKISSPPFDKSAMDGYAIKLEEGIKSFDVTEVLYAGDDKSFEVKSGQAIKIMTGAKIPKGTTCVVKKEDVTVNGNKITLDKECFLFDNICKMGEDVKEADVVLKAGKRLEYADIGILASIGVSKVWVFKKPTVGIITTGSEVVDIDDTLGEGKIYNSNKYLLASRLKELSIDVPYILHEEDTKESISSAILELKDKVDIIFTTGGVSVGDKDYLKEAIDMANGEKLFWKVLIKPGSAFLASKVGGKMVISLSGNPTAAITTFELMGVPVLKKLGGEDKVYIAKEEAIITKDFLKKAKNTRYVRGYTYIKDCKYYVDIWSGKSGNGMIGQLINSNALVEINGEVKAFEKVKIIKI